MPILVNPISDKQVQEVLAYTEGHFLDLKAKEIKTGKANQSHFSMAILCQHKLMELQGADHPTTMATDSSGSVHLRSEQVQGFWRCALNPPERSLSRRTRDG
jgi:hypothetical protein